ncbi:unnamed protein product [Bursaphelenchus okinawaensis]|uniref:Uncharacterized protein n=1 Tax=Bursaphelenchus okinawaensis TaxID=465554 RepID=A0A811JQ02_9BILA|nr:unnamed protein product [Bursaphelenchus okinawaensis]CAG9077075.1 unnamed protein product [Bursaphelenchus okinawaensis]
MTGLLLIGVVLLGWLLGSDARDCKSLPDGMFDNYFRIWSALLYDHNGTQINTTVLVGQFISNKVPSKTGISISFYNVPQARLMNMDFSVSVQPNYSQRNYDNSVIFSDGTNLYRVFDDQSLVVPFQGDLPLNRLFFYKNLLVLNRTHVIRLSHIITSSDHTVLNNFYESMLSLLHIAFHNETEIKQIANCMDPEGRPCVWDTKAPNGTLVETLQQKFEPTDSSVITFNGFSFTLNGFSKYTIISTTDPDNCFSGDPNALFKDTKGPEGYQNLTLMTTIPLFNRYDKFFKDHSNIFNWDSSPVSSTLGTGPTITSIFILCIMFMAFVY